MKFTDEEYQKFFDDSAEDTQLIQNEYTGYDDFIRFSVADRLEGSRVYRAVQNADMEVDFV